MKTKTKLLPLIPPGEILTEEFLKPLGVSEYRLSRAIAVPPRRINEIVHVRDYRRYRLALIRGENRIFLLDVGGKARAANIYEALRL